MSAPVTQEELPILEAVINIRNRLTALKKDRGEYIKPSDVNALYQAIIRQVTRLNEVRDENTTYNNRLDTTLADVFNLLSLFFLTIGRTKECPATYSQIASMRQILEHMDESGIYNESDLAPFHRRLAELRAIVRHDADSGRHPVAMTTLLERQLNECENVLRRLQESLAVLSPELVPIHERLVNIRRQLVALAAKETAREIEHANAFVVKSNESTPMKVPSRESTPFPEYAASINDTASDLEAKTPTKGSTPKAEVAKEKEGSRTKAELKAIMEELRKIDSKRVDGKFLGPGGTVPASQAICSSLLEECFEIAQEIRAQDDSKYVASSLKPIYDRLSEMRRELEQLVLTHRWSLRETDLWNYSLSLQEIDKMRVDGKFVDADGNRPSGQYVLLYLLRRCYGLIYRLLSSSEPVSEELMPIANKLSTVKKCLNEVLKYGGPFSPRDLYPYQLALYQIDSMRKDGKFVGVDGSIPEGQGIVMAHLNECHELLEMLKEAMEEGEDEVYGDEDEDEDVFDDPPEEEEERA
ncbi:uncharacterized protein LAESUDRAFT_722180 [Laetiporus sulphureus 93-53]|uniref:Uncharacterized protein n=1 Tax=Laetiporus sulphureus 93-53 TaxID=1314785 RepID=A0A165G9Q8_9APHY|nr:uncharacterized protein LAESUDRAFT_722180 [Laetiporus sulphureus 93-53]KZT10036.1 hypothetical protein LAESUDRAFT_722180 [Laetiporus sulphureus 93-53]